MTRVWRHRAVAAGAVLGCAVAALPAAALADVTVERYLKSGGVAGMGAGESTTVEKLSGLRKRETGSMKMTGLIGKMVGEVNSDTITDIPRDTEWKIDHKKKTYTESRLAPPPAEKGSREPEGKGEQAEKRKVRIVRNEITVKESGEKKTIAGYECRHFVVTWVLETEDLETKERGESTMVADLWTAPEDDALRALRAEEAEFTRAWLKKIGWEMSEAETQNMGLAAMAAFFGGDEASLKKGAKEVAEKMERIEGYPIATGIAWRVASSGGASAGQKESGAPAGMPDIAKGLGGLMSAFGKKGGAKGAPAGADAPPSGARPLFESYTEIRKVGRGGLSDADFQVPAGYKKTE